MAGEDFVNKGRDAVNDAVEKTKEVFEDVKGKVDGALGSEKAEEVSDSILDTVSNFAKKILPEETHAKIDEVRGNIDGATRVMTTAIALETSKGDLALAIALGMVLIVIILALNALAYVLRQWAMRRFG